MDALLRTIGIDDPFNRLVLGSSRLYLAAPYFTAGDVGCG